MSEEASPSIAPLQNEESIDIRKTMEEEMPGIEEAIEMYEFLKFQTELNMYRYYFQDLTEDQIIYEYFDKLVMQYFHQICNRTDEQIEEFCKHRFNKTTDGKDIEESD